MVIGKNLLTRLCLSEGRGKAPWSSTSSAGQWLIGLAGISCGHVAFVPAVCADGLVLVSRKNDQSKCSVELLNIFIEMCYQSLGLMSIC